MTTFRFFLSTAALAMALFLSALQAFAVPPASVPDENDFIDFNVASVQSGAQMSWGQCPCVNWTISVQGAGGSIQNKTFLISSDALFKMKEQIDLSGDEVAARLFTVGTFDALLKGAHVGIGFNGITLGKDDNLGYREIFRTGLYALLNLIDQREEAHGVRLDLRTGYARDQMRVHSGQKIVVLDIVEQSAILDWRAGNWGGEVSTYVGLQHAPVSSALLARAGMSVSTEIPVIRYKDLRVDLGMNMNMALDSFRKAVGMASTSLATGVFMNFAWVSKIEEPKQ